MLEWDECTACSSIARMYDHSSLGRMTAHHSDVWPLIAWTYDRSSLGRMTAHHSDLWPLIARMYDHSSLRCIITWMYDHSSLGNMTVHGSDEDCSSLGCMITQMYDQSSLGSMTAHHSDVWSPIAQMYDHDHDRSDAWCLTVGLWVIQYSYIVIGSGPVAVREGSVVHLYSKRKWCRDESCSTQICYDARMVIHSIPLNTGTQKPCCTSHKHSIPQNRTLHRNRFFNRTVLDTSMTCAQYNTELYFTQEYDSVQLTCWLNLTQVQLRGVKNSCRSKVTTSFSKLDTKWPLSTSSKQIHLPFQIITLPFCQTGEVFLVHFE